MYLLLWMVFGAIIGWLASIRTYNTTKKDVLYDILAGLLGSLFGGWSTSMMLGLSNQSFSWLGLLFAFIGACIFIKVVNLFSYKRTIE